MTVAAIVSLVLRYRRGSERVRGQILWLVLAVLVILVLNLERAVTGRGPELLLLSFVCVPVAIAIAIVRYRLLDIRLVVSRAVLYGLLITVVLLAYVGLVALATAALPSDLATWGPVTSAIVVALALNPVREGLQRLITRLFYGRRAANRPPPPLSSDGASTRSTDSIRSWRWPGRRCACRAWPSPTSTRCRSPAPDLWPSPTGRGRPSRCAAATGDCSVGSRWLCGPGAVPAAPGRRRRPGAAPGRTARPAAAGAGAGAGAARLPCPGGPGPGERAVGAAPRPARWPGTDADQRRVPGRCSRQPAGQRSGGGRGSAGPRRESGSGTRCPTYGGWSTGCARSRWRSWGSSARSANRQREQVGSRWQVMTTPAELGPLSPAVELAVYRIATEAITNAQRHSAGTEIGVSLASESGELHLVVQDDGAPPPAYLAGVGLRSIQGAGRGARWPHRDPSRPGRLAGQRLDPGVLTVGRPAVSVAAAPPPPGRDPRTASGRGSRSRSPSSCTSSTPGPGTHRR